MRLEDYIKSTGLSKSAWAVKVGIPQPVITRFLNGSRWLSLKNALKIQEVTRGMVRVDELYKDNHCSE